METILITGGAGFIGSHLVNHYSKNTKVIVLDNLSMGDILNILPSNNVTMIEGDITNEEDLEYIFNTYAFDYIFHLAAIASVAESIENPWGTHLVNQDATLLLLEKVMKQKKLLKRFIFASSAAVYGNNMNGTNSEIDAVDPLNPYAVDKYSSEKFALLYHQLYGLKTTAVRFFNVYGKNQNPTSPYSGVISILMDGTVQLKNGEPFIFNKYGKGDQTRDFVYVKDVIQALVLLTNEERAIGEVYNIGSGESISLNDVIKSCQEVSGFTGQITSNPAREGEVLNSLADISKLKVLGYKPKYSIYTGLLDYWEDILMMEYLKSKKASV